MTKAQVIKTAKKQKERKNLLKFAINTYKVQ